MGNNLGDDGFLDMGRGDWQQRMGDGWYREEIGGSECSGV